MAPGNLTLMISLSRVTILTPQPYEKADDSRQRENYYYMLNQIYSLAKADSDQDPFGLLAAIAAGRTTIGTGANVSLELDDLTIKIFGEAALIESP